MGGRVNMCRSIRWMGTQGSGWSARPVTARNEIGKNSAISWYRSPSGGNFYVCCWASLTMCPPIFPSVTARLQGLWYGDLINHSLHAAPILVDIIMQFIFMMDLLLMQRSVTLTLFWRQFVHTVLFGKDFLCQKNDNNFIFCYLYTGTYHTAYCCSLQNMIIKKDQLKYIACQSY